MSRKVNETGKNDIIQPNGIIGQEGWKMSEYVISAYGEALFRLMKDKNIEKITVDELCEEGDILKKSPRWI